MPLFCSLIHGRGRRKHVALSVPSRVNRWDRRDTAFRGGASDRSALDKEEFSWNQNYAWPCPWCWQGVCVRDSLRLENLHFDRTFLARRTLQPPLGADKKRWNYRAASIGQSRQSPRNRFGRSPFLEKPPAWNCIRSERAMFFSDRRCAWTSPWELIEPLWYAGDLRERKKKGGWETFDDSRGTQDYYRWKSGYFISNRIEKSARIRRDFRSTLLPRGNVKRHGIIRVI